MRNVLRQASRESLTKEDRGALQELQSMVRLPFHSHIIPPPTTLSERTYLTESNRFVNR
jgi:hypothetical protein